MGVCGQRIISRGRRCVWGGHQTPWGTPPHCAPPRCFSAAGVDTSDGTRDSLQSPRTRCYLRQGWIVHCTISNGCFKLSHQNCKICTPRNRIPCSMFLHLIQWIAPLVHSGKIKKTTEKVEEIKKEISLVDKSEIAEMIYIFICIYLAQFLLLNFNSKFQFSGESIPQNQSSEKLLSEIIIGF